jgi:hypothetical protein
VEKAETAARWASKLPVLEGTQLVIDSEDRVITCLKVPRTYRAPRTGPRGKLMLSPQAAAWTLWQWEPVRYGTPSQEDRSPL